jgi:hypothetical protein
MQSSRRQRWTEEEDALFLSLTTGKQHVDWDEVQRRFPDRSLKALKSRYEKRGGRTPAEYAAAKRSREEEEEEEDEDDAATEVDVSTLPIELIEAPRRAPDQGQIPDSFFTKQRIPDATRTALTLQTQNITNANALVEYLRTRTHDVDVDLRDNLAIPSLDILRLAYAWFENAAKPKIVLRFTHLNHDRALIKSLASLSNESRRAHGVQP